MTRTGLASGTRSLRLLARPWQLLCLLLGAVAILLFFYKGLHYADETQSELRLIPYLRYDERLDFNYFYGAADMVLHGDADLLYPDCSPGDYPQCSEPIHWPGDPLYSRPGVDEYTKAQAIVRGRYFALPAPSLLVRGARRAFAVMAVASALIFFVPFLATGLDVLPRYLDFVRDVADFNLEEAPHMFSWNGFLFKLGAEPVT